MNRQQQILKFQKKIKQEEHIENKIKQLKRELKKVHNEYHKKVYIILKEIIRLRKQQMKNYGIGELANERDIDLSYHQIAYIFGMDYLSEKTKDLIASGLLKTSTALFVIKQHHKFREPRFQNKVINMYLKGVLNTTEISRMANRIIDDNVNMNEEIKHANKQLQTLMWIIQDKIKFVKSKRKLFTDTKTIQYIIAQNQKLTKELRDILKGKTARVK